MGIEEEDAEAFIVEKVRRGRRNTNEVRGSFGTIGRPFGSFGSRHK